MACVTIELVHHLQKYYHFGEMFYLSRKKFKNYWKPLEALWRADGRICSFMDVPVQFILLSVVGRLLVERRQRNQCLRRGWEGGRVRTRL